MEEGLEGVGARGQQGGPRRGEDIEIQIIIEFTTSMFGGEEDVHIPCMEKCSNCVGTGAEKGAKVVTCTTCNGAGEVREQRQTMLGNIMTSRPCHTCHGQGKIPEKVCHLCHGQKRVKNTKELKVVIPKGVHDGAVLKLSGQGSDGLDAGPSGDVYVHIRVKQSKKFERDGNDIHTEQVVHVAQAVLGDDITVETVHGKKEIVLPAGIEDGKKIRLKSLGAYKVGSEEKGDHIVTVRIQIPKRLSVKEKELYMELAKEANLKVSPKKRGIFG